MTGRDIMADCDDLFENIYWRKRLLNKPFIKSYLASTISVEAKYYFLIHLINFRNKSPTKTHENPKWQNLNFSVFANPVYATLLMRNVKKLENLYLLQ